MVLVPLLVAGAACTSTTPRTGPTPESDAPTYSTPAAVTPASAGGVAATAALDCQDAIGDDSPPADYVRVLDVVGLPASPQHTSLQASDSGVTGRLRLFAKAGLVIRTGTTFEIVVPDDHLDRAAVVWGSPGTPTTHLTVTDCRSPGDAWLAYAGGYLVSEPMCLPLLIRAGGREQRVPIGVGTECPGQPAASLPGG